MIVKAKAFAPASIANVAVGFDILGFSFPTVGDTVTVTRLLEPKVIVTKVSGVISDAIPKDANKNTAAVALEALRISEGLSYGFSIEIEKGIPLSSGMGGSAASAVAAVVAANSLLERPLNQQKLIEYALQGEAAASGSIHADNVAPCMMGGLCLAVTHDPPNIIQVPVPKEILVVLVHPQLQIDTKTARSILKRDLMLSEHVHQSARLGGFVAACFLNNIPLISTTMLDLIVEPQRKTLIPGFSEAKKKALSLGAIGFSIAGSGPSVFAWVVGLENANRV